MKICLNQAKSWTIKDQFKIGVLLPRTANTPCEICGIWLHADKMVWYSVFHVLCFPSAFGIWRTGTSTVHQFRWNCSKKNLQLKEVPLLAILTRNISSNFFPLVLVNMSVQFLKKNCMLPTFENRHFVRVCTEKTMDHQYRENGARNIYSNYNQMRAYVECSPNQSKKLYLIDISIEQSTKLWGFRNIACRFCISVLPEYCSSALTAQAYKMVITTVCVQIDNCFCNTWIVVHLCASLRWFRDTLVLAIYSVFFFNLNLVCEFHSWAPVHFEFDM